MSGLCCHLKTEIKDKPQDSVINRNTQLPPYLKKLLTGWLVRADVNSKQSSCENYFQPFIYLWIAFNSYLLNVAEEDIGDQERDLIYAIAHDSEMNNKFTALYYNKTDFREIVDEFSSLWPIFRVKDLVREGIDGWRQYSTDESREFYRNRIFQHNKNKVKKDRILFEPRCFMEHSCEKPPSDWTHTLLAIYQIRCNLFHGGKSFLTSRDKEFVRYAYVILWEVWGKGFH